MPVTVSILMACYNAARYVHETLESLRAQTFTDFEIVVVDDGSTDSSAMIVERHAGDRVRLIRQDNQGAARARNGAFANSRGEYVLFLDADDIVAPTHLEALLTRAEEASDCVAVSRWDRFRIDLSEARFPGRPTERDLPGPDWLELDWRDARPMTQSGMILLPRRLIERFGGWDERLTLHDDFEFFARIISQAQAVLFAPGARLYYRSAVPGSLSALQSRAAIESAYLSVDLGTRHLLAAKDTHSTRGVCANLLQDFHYKYYPAHADLRAKALARVQELGGADLEPDGPPRFQALRRYVGWKLARRVQRAFGR
jgi:glycosyltransferase involved in cell wall biosynthesis